MHLQLDSAENYFTNDYRGFGEFGIGKETFALSTIQGYQIIPKLFVGGGLGYYKFSDDSDENYNLLGDDTKKDVIAIPLFGDARFDFMNKKYSPFVEGRLGISMAGDARGWHFAVAGGFRIHQINFSFSVIAQDFDGEIILTNHFRVAFDWGARK